MSVNNSWSNIYAQITQLTACLSEVVCSGRCSVDQANVAMGQRLATPLLASASHSLTSKLRRANFWQIDILRYMNNFHIQLTRACSSVVERPLCIASMCGRSGVQSPTRPIPFFLLFGRHRQFVDCVMLVLERSPSFCFCIQNRR
jgi:hypothetical protein